MTADVYAARIPARVGAWSGADVPLTERQYQLLESRDVLLRDYQTEAGGSVLACVAVAGGNRKVAPKFTL